MLRFASAQTQDKGVYESLDRTTDSATWEPEQAYYTSISPKLSPGIITVLRQEEGIKPSRSGQLPG